MTSRQWQAHVKSRIRRGESKERIVNDLVTRGFSPQEAQQLVQGERQSHASSGLKLLVGGLAFAFLGFVITIGTYENARSSGGGQYYIWFGPMIAGVCLAVFGLVRMLRLVD